MRSAKGEGWGKQSKLEGGSCVGVDVVLRGSVGRVRVREGSQEAAEGGVREGEVGLSDRGSCCWG